MGKKRPLILISNDDGYQSGGLSQLLEILKPLNLRLVVMAPDSARSGFSMAMTSQSPVTFHKISEDDNLTIYACSGTPVDCVKLAFYAILGDEKPDLVIAGINHGDNASVNVHYSGTMGVTIEGCLKGIPSIAFSSCDASPSGNYMNYSPYIQDIVRFVLREGLPERTCLNVNFPKEESCKGLKICRQDRGDWHQEWEVCRRENGSEHYWLSGYYESQEPMSTDTDRWALEHGYIAVTPTTVDVTSYPLLEALKSKFEG